MRWGEKDHRGHMGKVGDYSVASGDAVSRGGWEKGDYSGAFSGVGGYGKKAIKASPLRIPHRKLGSGSNPALMDPFFTVRIFHSPVSHAICVYIGVFSNIKSII